MEQQTGSKQEKEYVKAIYCHPAYLTYVQSISCRNAQLDEAQAGIKIAEGIAITLDMQKTLPLRQKVKKN